MNLNSSFTRRPLRSTNVLMFTMDCLEEDVVVIFPNDFWPFIFPWSSALGNIFYCGKFLTYNWPGCENTVPVLGGAWSPIAKVSHRHLWTGMKCKCDQMEPSLELGSSWCCCLLAPPMSWFPSPQGVLHFKIDMQGWECSLVVQHLPSSQDQW